MAMTEPYWHRNRLVAAKLTNAEHARFVEIAASHGLKPCAYAAVLVRDEMRREAEKETAS